VVGASLTAIPADLAPSLVPLAWLLGSWEGVGVVGYPTMPADQQFGQEITVEHDGRAFLRWNSRTWALDPDGAVGRPLGTESGFWRVLGPSGGEAGATVADRSATPVPAGFDVELLLSHPTGIIEMYAGTAAGARIDLATDVVMRSPAAKAYTAARRLYGMVEGDLLWAMDMAAMGHELTPHASARLRRTS